ncbi:MAG: hypothetical protein COV57_02610 [Candidatus Liptonbacteria bacterium CG11_big_fil_rev_8_21_14_0_20_35_14]|uniref:Uncharacterized protein n=1 Tax=Candidatus Liptonbacteria bacterium CG11_big_fil_rev_8_21_14_0_20_35_14 TaxID=1974634 RepID=A0A2H0N7A3_9BACT|nr:MAG: hypothetical protein COV57_02610 [Candidatus Liptonbacteria bacterium CG11_big_fil_rev_8_21_14_0_20_35_14]
MDQLIVGKKLDSTNVPSIRGHNKKYVMSLMERGLQRDDIQDIIIIRQETRASVSKILKLKENGYSLDEISEFYTIRENHISMHNLSIDMIVKLYEKFGKDFDIVQNFIEDAIKLYFQRTGFLGGTINYILYKSEKMNENPEFFIKRLIRDDVDPDYDDEYLNEEGIYGDGDGYVDCKIDKVEYPADWEESRKKEEK